MIKPTYAKNLLNQTLYNTGKYHGFAPIAYNSFNTFNYQNYYTFLEFTPKSHYSQTLFNNRGTNLFSNPNQYTPLEIIPQAHYSQSIFSTWGDKLYKAFVVDEDEIDKSIEIIELNIEQAPYSLVFRHCRQDELLSLINGEQDYPKRFKPVMDSEDIEKHILQNCSKWYSACRTVDDLKGAYDHSGGPNGSYKEAAIVVFEPQKILCPYDLGTQLGCNSKINVRRGEKEIIPIGDISKNNILVIVDKKDKEAFYAGKRVDNMMA